MQILPVGSEELGNYEYERIAPQAYRAFDHEKHETRLVLTEDFSENAILIRKPWGLDLEEVIGGLL